MKRAIGVALLSLFAAATAPAADLLSVYQDALANDPAIREADATRKANREARPQAWAALLPQISGTASLQRGTQDSSQQFSQLGPNGQPVVFNQVVHREPDTRTWAINLRQNLFSWSYWSTLRAANYQVAQAEADYQAAEQDLISRAAFVSCTSVMAMRPTSKRLLA